jgi:hypothetical protein
MVIAKPRMGRITQGTVFCAGVAEDYRGRPVWGVVITARCDTAHEKTPIVNYLPVVTIEDWLVAHGGILCLEKEDAEVRNRLRSLLTKRSLSDSLLLVHSPDDIAQKHFPVPPELTNQKAQKEAKDAEAALEIATRLNKVQQWLDCPLPNHAALQQAIRSCKKHVEAVIKELIGHRLAGYYFLPDLGDITERRSTKGYVVLLREVHHVPRRGVAALRDGIAAADVGSEPIGGLCFDCFDFAFPVAELSSPWTEHLMQSFCNLFGRIGVADADKLVVLRILDDIQFDQ